MTVIGYARDSTDGQSLQAQTQALRRSLPVCSIALQFGADVETICRALCRDGSGNASGPLGVALDCVTLRECR